MLLYLCAIRSQCPFTGIHTHAHTFGAKRVKILAKITWPVRAKRIWLRNVENHITHSKSATSCSRRGKLLAQDNQRSLFTSRSSKFKYRTLLGQVSCGRNSPFSCQNNAILASHCLWRSFCLCSLNIKEDIQDIFFEKSVQSHTLIWPFNQ